MLPTRVHEGCRTLHCDGQFQSQRNHPGPAENLRQQGAGAGARRRGVEERGGGRAAGRPCLGRHEAAFPTAGCARLVNICPISTRQELFHSLALSFYQLYRNSGWLTLCQARPGWDTEIIYKMKTRPLPLGRGLPPCVARVPGTARNNCLHVGFTCSCIKLVSKDVNFTVNIYGTKLCLLTRMKTILHIF